MSALDGALSALRRVAEQRTSACLAEVERHRSWLRDRLAVANQQVAAQPAVGSGSAKRQRTKAQALAEVKEVPAVDSGPPVQLPPVQQPPRTRRGKAPEDGAAAKAGAAVGALHEEEVAVPPRQESPSSAPPDDADTTEPPAAPDAAVVALSGPVVPPTEDVSVQPHSAAANTRAADVVAEPASEQPQVEPQAQPAVVPLAVPLPPSSPAVPEEPALTSIQEPAAVASGAAPAALVPSVKHKVIALAMAEQARKKEEQLQQERKQKKEQLERQREAARQLAMQGLPKAAATAAPGDSSAKAMQPAALPASALAPRPMLESAAKASAIPRLKQAMEARAAQRNNVDLAAKDKAPVQEAKPAALGDASNRPLPAAEKSVTTPVVSPPVAVKPLPQQATAAPMAPPPSLPSAVATQAGAAPEAAAPEMFSYEISPYKSGSDSDEEERPRKPVPSWARTEAVVNALQGQLKADPDAIFANPQRTCSLVEVFQYTHNKKRDFTRRGSSGNWAEDQLTWKEELSFKRRMGYMPTDGLPAATPHSAGR